MGYTPPDSPLDGEDEAEPTLAEDECIKAGAKMLYREHEVTVLRIGVEGDHFNNGRVRITWEQVKKGCTRKKETLTRWVGPNELRHKPQPVEGGPPSPAVQSPTTRAMAAAETARAEQRAAQRQAAEDALPERAAHERQRQLSQKAPAASRRYSDVYKTKESKVPLEKRLEQFKDNTLVITNGPDGKKLFCRACKHTFHNVWSMIDDHCKRQGHKNAVIAFNSRVDDDAQLKDDILTYYAAHPGERQSSVGGDEMVFRYRTVETFLASGTPLSVCDIFRPLLQRAGFALTEHRNLKVFIPRIEEHQIQLLKSELSEQYISVAFDGTTRLGEAINVVGRWCSSNFEIVNRLLDFTTLEKHVNAVGLCSHINDLIGLKRGIPSANVVGFSRDSVSTNGAACRRLMIIYTSAADLLCICHTLCHVGEHFQLPTLDEFMTPWLELVGGRNPHAGAKMLWKETVAPAAVPGYSHVRWYSKAEIIFVIGEAGTRRLRDFLIELRNRDYGEATRIKMQNIYDQKGDRLRLEIAGLLDMRKLVSTTYELEGDRLEILLVYERIEALRSLGNSLRSHADGILPNVDAVLRRLMELKAGVKIEKYFQGAGVHVGVLKKKEKIISTLYPGQEREAWQVEYSDGHTEDFEEEELRSGKDGPAPAGQDGKPVLIVRHLKERSDLCDAFAAGFDYLETRITGTCDDQYSCVQMYELCRVARAFNPNFAANHMTPAFVDAMAAITPLMTHGLISALKRELPLYLSAAQSAGIFDTTDVESFTNKILDWWRTNGSSFPAWALAARITFSLTPNSAACERIFSLLKQMFGDAQMSALADYIRAALMLKYNERMVG